MYEMKITKFLIRLLCVLAVLVAQVEVRGAHALGHDRSLEARAGRGDPVVVVA